MHLTPHDVGVSAHLGSYSDAIEVAPNVRWLVTAGTPGFASDGTLPSDFAAQASSAWDNVKRLLEDAGFALSDLVKVTTSVTNVSDIAAYQDIRRHALGDLKPAFMLAVVTQLIDPRILIEVEVWAAKPAGSAN
ncbi:MAG TPA: Rid family hydrolase [Streptosporangiaceae bacterium]|jgi:enamine deaminase RidA (YjgF/YER057c/UK114 family)